MALASVQSNNKSVEFHGKGEREMPMESKAQNAAMHAAAEGKSTIGIPKKVGKKFVKESHGQKIKKLPQHMRKRGLVSEKAAKAAGME